MSLSITFSDGKTYNAIMIKGDDILTNSRSDVMNESKRKTVEMHFDSASVNKDELQEYYLNPDEKMGIFTITTDDNEVFTHKDFVVPLKYGLEYVGNDTNPHVILSFAQLTETDKLLRDLYGKRKVYTGTGLEIAIEKKKDEIASECNNAICSGIDYNNEHYSLTLEDQAVLNSLKAEIITGLQAVPYHADGGHCRPYTAEEFLGLVNAAKAHITHHTTYCNLLKRYTESLTDVLEIENITYGITELTGVYLEEYNVATALLIPKSE